MNQSAKNGDAGPMSASSNVLSPPTQDLSFFHQFPLEVDSPFWPGWQPIEANGRLEGLRTFQHATWTEPALNSGSHDHNNSIIQFNPTGHGAYPMFGPHSYDDAVIDPALRSMEQTSEVRGQGNGSSSSAVARPFIAVDASETGSSGNTTYRDPFSGQSPSYNSPDPSRAGADHAQLLPLKGKNNDKRHRTKETLGKNKKPTKGTILWLDIAKCVTVQRG